MTKEPFFTRIPTMYKLWVEDTMFAAIFCVTMFTFVFNWGYPNILARTIVASLCGMVFGRVLMYIAFDRRRIKNECLEVAASELLDTMQKE